MASRLSLSWYSHGSARSRRPAAAGPANRVATSSAAVANSRRCGQGWRRDSERQLGQALLWVAAGGGARRPALWAAISAAGSLVEDLQQDGAGVALRCGDLGRGGRPGTGEAQVCSESGGVSRGGDQEEWPVPVTGCGQIGSEVTGRGRAGAVLKECARGGAPVRPLNHSLEAREVETACVRAGFSPSCSPFLALPRDRPGGREAWTTDWSSVSSSHRRQP